MFGIIIKIILFLGLPHFKKKIQIKKFKEINNSVC